MHTHHTHTHTHTHMHTHTCTHAHVHTHTHTHIHTHIHTHAHTHTHTLTLSLTSLSLSLMHTFWILQFRITVYPSIADTAVSRVEDVCKLTGLERAWHSSNEDGLPRINGIQLTMHKKLT